jgi:predicted molibdopterin-dependent oxidoreductase YjgC
MMGVCFECLVEVDGKPGRQACLTTVRDGMVIRRQQGASALPQFAQGEAHGR